MKKIRWIIGIGLLVIIVVVAIGVAASLDKIVKAGVETYGPKITQVSVTLDDVHISLLGSAKVKGLVVGNPKGYQTPNAISVGSADVSMDPFSILSDKIVLHSVKIENPEITFEGGLSGNNISKILDNIDSTSGNGSSAAANSTTNSQPSKKFEIDDLVITGGEIHVSVNGLGGREMTLPLPDIELTDLGKGKDGITAAEVIRAVMSRVSAETLKAVANAGKDVGNAATSAAKGAEKTVTQGVNNIGQGINNLIKNK